MPRPESTNETIPVIVVRMMQEIAGLGCDIDALCDSVDSSDLRHLAVRRLHEEMPHVLAKGLSPSRLENWCPGARSRVAREYGSAAGLVTDILGRAARHARSQRLAVVATYAPLLGATDPRPTVMALAGSLFDDLSDSACFRLSVTRWLAMPDVSFDETAAAPAHENAVELAGGLKLLADVWQLEFTNDAELLSTARAMLGVLEGLTIQRTADDRASRREAAQRGFTALFFAAAHPPPLEIEPLRDLEEPGHNDRTLATRSVLASPSANSQMSTRELWQQSPPTPRSDLYPVTGSGQRPVSHNVVEQAPLS